MLEESSVDRGYTTKMGINTGLYMEGKGFAFKRQNDEEGLSGIEAVLKKFDELEGDFRGTELT